MKLGIEPRTAVLGERDAVHVPIVTCEAHDYKNLPAPSDWVRFTDDKFTTVVKCEKKDAHGIADPFLDEISAFQRFAVLIVPGVTTDVRHEFQIIPELRDAKRQALEFELEQIKLDDQACSDCWVIRNNNILRM